MKELATYKDHHARAVKGLWEALVERDAALARVAELEAEVAARKAGNVSLGEDLAESEAECARLREVLASLDAAAEWVLRPGQGWVIVADLESLVALRAAHESARAALAPKPGGGA